MNSSSQNLQMGRPRLAHVEKRRSLRHAFCAVALWGWTSAVAAPASLGGATLCLSPTNSVFVSGVARANSDKLADHLYAEMKSLFRGHGIRFMEVAICKKSPAALTLFLDVTPVRGSSTVETRISVRVANDSQDAGGWLPNSTLRWSGVRYGTMSTEEAEIKIQLLGDARDVLAHLVADWKGTNP
jgi:hypothetical protein